MKNGSPIIKYLMTLICLAMLAYFSIQLYQYSTDPLMTTAAYAYQVEESLPVTGYVIRQERVLEGEGLLRLVRAEGDRVSSGGLVAQVYADQASLDRQDEIDRLQERLEQLEAVMDVASSSQVSLKLDSQIAEKLIATRQSLAADRLDMVREDASTLKSLVLRRDFTYTDAEDVSAQIQDLTAQLKSLRAQTSGSVKSVRAPVSGIYSAEVDGYEAVLTPEMLEGLRPSTLNSVQPSGGGNPVGKLILGDDWYYAVVLSREEAAEWAVGDWVTLRFAKGVDSDLNVQICEIGPEESGRVAVVFHSNAYLAQMTLLRRQSADVIQRTISGIRVPLQAVRVERQTVTGEDGKETAQQVTGVYCMVGLKSWFKPVELLWSGDGFALVRPLSSNNTLRLRPGDQVIISAPGLQNGSVVG